MIRDPTVTLKNSSPMQLGRVREMLQARGVALIVVVHSIICLAILGRVAYTEIDFSTYMQQVQLFLNGERDYYEIKGNTGPIVYPAGFLYLYSAMRMLDVYFSGVFAVQIVFGILCVATVLISVKNGLIAGVPIWVLSLSLLSRRTYSIFLLRLFNDAPCALLSHLCVYFFIRKKWALGCVFLSLAVSVKMNALLYAPGVAFILFKNLPSTQAIAYIVGLCGGLQLALALPFLAHHPVAYMHKAFELSRKFNLYWSTNFQFLSESVFASPLLSIGLLAFTIIAYIGFARKVWTSKNMLLILYSSNFIGVTFSRSIHYQFYVWYSFSLPALVYWAKWTSSEVVNWCIRAVVLIGIELVYNMPGGHENPSTPFSSAMWHVLHLTLLLGLWRRGSRVGDTSTKRGVSAKKKKVM